jgi:hypothetical protein
MMESETIHFHTTERLEERRTLEEGDRVVAVRIHDSEITTSESL